MTLEGEPVEAELRSVDENRVSFAAKAPIALPLDELVRWGHPQLAGGQTIVVLADGGRLVTAAAWAGGAAVQVEGDTITVLSDNFDEVPLPSESVLGIVFAMQSHPREREKLAVVAERSSPNPSLKESGTESTDIVLLSNDDRVMGTVAAITGGSLTLETGADSVKLPLSRVEAVVFQRKEPAKSFGGSPGARPQPPHLVVGLKDGSLIYATNVVADADKLSVTMRSGQVLTGGSVKDVALLHSMSGKFVYLSDLEPSGYRHVPYLSIEWPYQGDRNVLGEPLTVGDQRYLKGLGMHSAARLTYRLDGNYRRFDAQVAVDDSAGNKGSVTFGVYVLRDGAWRAAYSSGIVRGGEPPQPVSVDTSGAEGLTLTVDYADRGDELDHADWLDARLIK